jgi:dipeptide/tripeptide permease
MENDLKENTSAAMQQLIAECDPNERIAFSTGLLLSTAFFCRLTWNKTQEDLGNTGQVNDSPASLLLQSLDELRTSIVNLKSDPEELAPASPKLQEMVRHALGFAAPFSEIAGKYLKSIEDLTRPASDSVS